MTIRETAKRYDRSIVAVLVALGIIFSVYFRIGGNIEKIISESSSIREIKNEVVTNKKLQDQLNEFVGKKLDSIDEKLGQLLRRKNE